MRTRIFMAALFAIAPNQKLPARPPTVERINKLWDSHTVENYLEIKMNEPLPPVIEWMNLAGIRRGERSQNQEKMYRMIPLT